MKSSCAHCRAQGHRECDECSGPVFPHQFGLAPDGRDLCAYCLDDLGIELPPSPLELRMRAAGLIPS
jgi:hypothetical protein